MSVNTSPLYSNAYIIFVTKNTVNAIWLKWRAIVRISLFGKLFNNFRYVNVVSVLVEYKSHGFGFTFFDM